MSEDAHTITLVPMALAQPLLFPGLPLPVVYPPGGYARPPGTGPKGETCKTCAFCCYTGNGKRRYPKCAVIKFRWTHGPGTDIKLRSPACDMWQDF